MSVRKDKVQIEVEINGFKAAKEFKRLDIQSRKVRSEMINLVKEVNRLGDAEKELERVNEEMREMEKNGKTQLTRYKNLVESQTKLNQTIANGESTLKRFNKEYPILKNQLDKVNQSIIEQSRVSGVSFDQLQKRQRYLLVQIRKTLDPKIAALFQKELDELNPRIAALRKRMTGTAKALNQVRIEGVKTTGVFGKLIRSAGGLIGTFGAVFAVDRIIDWSKQLFTAGVQSDALARKAQTVLGPELDKVEERARRNAEALGLTERGYVNNATAIADLLIPMGFHRDESAALSTDLVDLSGSLAEWDTEQRSSTEISKILSKALLGEREEMKSLGIAISENDVKQRLAAKGMADLTGQALQQAKAMATLELILEKSADAQASFAKNTESAVRLQAELVAKFETVRAAISNNLIPVFTRLLGVANDFTDWILSYIETPWEEEMKKEQSELNLLVSRITDASNSQEERNALIQELQREYPDFLGNLDAESVTNQELATRLEAVNNQYIFKIALQKEDDKIQQQLQKVAEERRNSAESDLIAQQEIIRLNEKYQLGLDLTNKSLDERLRLVREGVLATQQDLNNEIEGIILRRDLGKLTPGIREINQNRIDAQQTILNQLEQTREELKKNLAAQLGITTATEETAEANIKANIEKRILSAKSAEAAQKEREEEFKIEQKALELHHEREKLILEAKLLKDEITEKEYHTLIHEENKRFYQAELDLLAQYGKAATNDALKIQNQLLEAQSLERAPVAVPETLAAPELQEIERTKNDVDFSRVEAETERELILLENKFAKLIISEQEFEIQRLEIQSAALERKLTLLRVAGETESNEYLKLETERLNIKKEIEKEKSDLVKRTFNVEAEMERRKLQLSQNALSAGIELLSTDENARRKHAAAIKAFETARVLVNLQTEIQGYWSRTGPIPFAGPGLASALSAVAVIRALAAVKRITAQRFYEGGIVRAYTGQKITGRPNAPTQQGGDNILAFLKSGEVVLNQEQQEKLGGAATFAQIGVPGFNEGGAVAAQFTTVDTTPRGDFVSDFQATPAAADNSAAIIASVERMVEAVERIPRTIKAQVVYEDFQNIEAEADESESKAGL